MEMGACFGEVVRLEGILTLNGEELHVNEAERLRAGSNLPFGFIITHNFWIDHIS